MTYPLGKTQPIHDPRTFQLASYLSTAASTVPAAQDWTHDITKFGMMLNDTLGDCTCAAVGHYIQVQSVNAGGAEITVADGDVLALYEGAAGYKKGKPATDRGAACLTVLNYVRKNGIAGGKHKLLAYAALEPSNTLHIKQSIFFFGAVYTGVALPISAQGQAVWSVPSGGPVGRGAPGSWGGHCISAVAYNAIGPVVISWGQLYQVTWAFWTTYCDEAYAVLGPDWLNANKAPNGFNLAALQKDLSTVA